MSFRQRRCWASSPGAIAIPLRICRLGRAIFFTDAASGQKNHTCCPYAPKWLELRAKVALMWRARRICSAANLPPLLGIIYGHLGDAGERNPVAPARTKGESSDDEADFAADGAAIRAVGNCRWAALASVKRRFHRWRKRPKRFAPIPRPWTAGAKSIRESSLTMCGSRPGRDDDLLWLRLFRGAGKKTVAAHARLHQGPTNAKRALRTPGVQRAKPFSRFFRGLLMYQSIAVNSDGSVIAASCWSYGYGRSVRTRYVRAAPLAHVDRGRHCPAMPQFRHFDAASR